MLVGSIGDVDELRACAHPQYRGKPAIFPRLGRVPLHGDSERKDPGNCLNPRQGVNERQLACRLPDLARTVSLGIWPELQAVTL